MPPVAAQLCHPDLPAASRARGTRRPLVALLACLFAVGCLKSEPARFRVDTVSMTRDELTNDQQQTIATVLEALFGTPDNPQVFPETGLDAKKIRLASGPVWSDELGVGHGLYRRHCAHCHGISGDGMGPTAAFLNPYPRDYRQGKFKFKSTERPARPTRADLRRIIHDGIPGTAMPSFRLLPAAEIDALVEYVTYLSMRGETETSLIYETVDLGEDEQLDLSREFLVEEVLASVANKWSSAEGQVIQPGEVPPAERSPEELAKSVATGRDLFYGKAANCFSCHGESALGDGQLTNRDDWNEVLFKVHSDMDQMRETLASPDAPADADQRERIEGRLASLDSALVGTLPVRYVRPRNLRLDVYRGGRRPIDLYRRIHAGINGAPMPAAAKLKPEEIWHLVDYVRQLPFEPASLPPRLSPTVQRERP